MAGRRPAYLFDQVRIRNPQSVIRMNARVADCYAWAEAHGYWVADEFIDWADGSGQVTGLFAESLSICHRDQAVLLVHSLDVLPGPIPEPWRSTVPVVVVRRPMWSSDHREAGGGVPIAHQTDDTP